MMVNVKHTSTLERIDEEDELFSEKMEETDNDIDIDIDIVDDIPDVTKAYKEKPYTNSNKEPFGLTLNGNSKEYILAHGAIKSLIKKGKEVSTAKGK